MGSAQTNVHNGPKASFTDLSAERMFIEKTILPQNGHLKPLKSRRLRSIKCPGALRGGTRKRALACAGALFVVRLARR